MPLATWALDGVALGEWLSAAPVGLELGVQVVTKTRNDLIGQRLECAAIDAQVRIMMA